MKKETQDKCFLVAMILLMAAVLVIGFLTISEIPTEALKIYPLMPSMTGYPVGPMY